jgi:hypothetical protein
MGSKNTFRSRRIGPAGHEILTPDGVVVAWTVDEFRAAIVAAGLKLIGGEGMHSSTSHLRWSADEDRNCPPPTTPPERHKAPEM